MLFSTLVLGILCAGSMNTSLREGNIPCRLNPPAQPPWEQR